MTMSIVSSVGTSLESVRDGKNRVTVLLIDIVGSATNVFKTFKNNSSGNLRTDSFTGKHRPLGTKGSLLGEAQFLKGPGICLTKSMCKIILICFIP